MERPKMIRKQVYILSQQDALLKETVAKYGTSEGELIRMALDKHLPIASPYTILPNYDAWQQERKFIESRMATKGSNQDEPNAARQWRRGDLYDV